MLATRPLRAKKRATVVPRKDWTKGWSTVVVHGDDQEITIWTNFGELSMRRSKAKAFVNMLMDEGITVESFWEDCGDKMRSLLGKRILTGTGA